MQNVTSSSFPRTLVEMQPQKLHQVLFARFVKNYLWFVSYQTRPWTWSALCSEYLRCVSRNPGKRRINVTICHFITQPRTGKHALSTHCCDISGLSGHKYEENMIFVYYLYALNRGTDNHGKALVIVISHFFISGHHSVLCVYQWPMLILVIWCCLLFSEGGF